MFPANNLLVVTSIDIQSVESVDQRTRDSLQKSVQLAIEITTNSQEAAARHEAERLEQEAKGRLGAVDDLVRKTLDRQRSRSPRSAARLYTNPYRHDTYRTIDSRASKSPRKY